MKARNIVFVESIHEPLARPSSYAPGNAVMRDHVDPDDVVDHSDSALLHPLGDSAAELVARELFEEELLLGLLGCCGQHS